jgi:hypothetical protein
MARQSFTLRRTSFEGGSYLQYYPSDSSASAGAASATFLRGDNIQIAPNGEVGSILNSPSIFEAYAYDYGIVKLNWGITLSPVGLTPSPYSVYIVYSSAGHPETIAEGQILVETRTQSEFLHIEVPNTWAYYTMFVRFVSSNGDDYYEPVARLSVLMPTNYESTDSLYKRIPAYYRNLDQESTESLYKYLSIFGWDIDRIRTTLDYMISMKDPQVAEVETLNNLAYEMGVDLEAHELSAERLRNLLDSIGTIRRSKGTPSAISQELGALAGAQVDINTTTKTIKVYAQRCNLIKDPMQVNGVAAGIDGGSPLSTSVITYDASTVGSSYSPGGLDGGTPSSSGSSSTVTTQKWVSYPSPSNVNNVVLETAYADVPVIAGDVLYFSIQTGNSLKKTQDSVVSVSLYTTGGTASGTLIVTDTVPVIVDAVHYWKLVVPETYTTYTNAVLSINFASNKNDMGYVPEDFKYLLMERNFEGTYFDGDTILGGWLVEGGTSISDYRWLDPANPTKSFSVYTANFQKTKNVIKRMISHILPASELITSGTAYSNVTPTANLKYTITHNNVPGI